MCAGIVSNTLSFKRRIMVKYCGYLVGDDWLLQRALDMGMKPPETPIERSGVVLAASRNARLNTGVHFYTKLRRVKTPQGKSWCIAFASNDPHEDLPTSCPPEEKYKALQELLQSTVPPRWFRGS